MGAGGGLPGETQDSHQTTGCLPSHGPSPALQARAPACPGGTLLRLTRGPGDP